MQRIGFAIGILIGLFLAIVIIQFFRWVNWKITYAEFNREKYNNTIPEDWKKCPKTVEWYNGTFDSFKKRMKPKWYEITFF